MDQERALDIFRRHDALLEGHFGLASGLHSPKYLQCALVLQHPRVAEELCAALAAPWRDEAPDAVIGPATGGIIPAYEIARHLGARALFTERVEGRMALRRCFGVAPGERLLVVEDVMTTGGSAAEVVEMVEALGAAVIGVACLVDRGGLGRFSAYRTASLLSFDLPVWPPEQCPLCRQGLPLTKPGSRGASSAASPGAR